MLKRVSAMYSNSASNRAKSSAINTTAWDDLNAELEKVIENEINLAQEFLADHQYYSSYGYKQHPKIVPLHILAAFLEILHSSGLYCADVAAGILLEDVEKMKEEIIPDNRHLLLLTMVSTVLHKIRAIIKNTFNMYSEKETLYKFSAAKVLKVFDIFRELKPSISFPQHQRLFEHKGSRPNNIEKNGCLCKSVEDETVDIVPQSKWRNCYSGISQNGMSDFVSPASPRNVCKSLAYFKLRPDGIEKLAHFSSACKGSQAQYMSWKNVAENFCGRVNTPSNSHVRNDSELEPYHKQQHRNFNSVDESKLNGIIFVKDRLTANVLYQVFDNLQFLDDDFAFLMPRCLDDPVMNRAINWDKASYARVDNMGDCRHDQDRLRLQQYNLLIATSSVGNNINVKCGLVLHYHNSST